MTPKQEKKRLENRLKKKYKGLKPDQIAFYEAIKRLPKKLQFTVIEDCYISCIYNGEPKFNPSGDWLNRGFVGMAGARYMAPVGKKEKRLFIYFYYRKDTKNRYNINNIATFIVDPKDIFFTIRPSGRNESVN